MSFKKLRPEQYEETSSYCTKRTHGTIFAESLLRKMTYRTVIKDGKKAKAMLLPPNRKVEIEP